MGFIGRLFGDRVRRLELAERRKETAVSSMDEIPDETKAEMFSAMERYAKDLAVLMLEKGKSLKDYISSKRQYEPNRNMVVQWVPRAEMVREMHQLLKKMGISVKEESRVEFDILLVEYFDGYVASAMETPGESNTLLGAQIDRAERDHNFSEAPTQYGRVRGVRELSPGTGFNAIRLAGGVDKIQRAEIDYRNLAELPEIHRKFLEELAQQFAKEEFEYVRTIGIIDYESDTYHKNVIPQSYEQYKRISQSIQGVTLDGTLPITPHIRFSQEMVGYSFQNNLGNISKIGEDLFQIYMQTEFATVESDTE